MSLSTLGFVSQHVLSATAHCQHLPLFLPTVTLALRHSKRVLHLPPSPKHPSQTSKTPSSGDKSVQLQPTQTTSEVISHTPPCSPECIYSSPTNSACIYPASPTSQAHHTPPVPHNPARSLSPTPSTLSISSNNSSFFIPIGNQKMTDPKTTTSIHLVVTCPPQLSNREITLKSAKDFKNHCLNYFVNAKGGIEDNVKVTRILGCFENNLVNDWISVNHGLKRQR